MKKNNQYEINFASNTIIVTKAFLEKASQMDTPEYATMTQLRALNMPISVREIHRKTREARWNCQRMEIFIKHTVDSERHMKDYETMLETYGYMKTWGWFKNTFANYKTAKLNEKHQYITMTKEEMDAAKQKKAGGAFTEKTSSSKNTDKPVSLAA